jgi:hypothetical protein
LGAETEELLARVLHADAVHTMAGMVERRDEDEGAAGDPALIDGADDGELEIGGGELSDWRRCDVLLGGELSMDLRRRLREVRRDEFVLLLEGATDGKAVAGREA